MRKNFVIPLLFSVVLITQCASPKELSYELPEAMIPTAKVGFAAQCDKGKILYDLTCAKCHNIKTNRKEIIPDFTTEQLIGYELRITNAEHESRMSEELLSAEELGYILTFLSYKKKSGTAFISKVPKSGRPHNH